MLRSTTPYTVTIASPAPPSPPSAGLDRSHVHLLKLNSAVSLAPFHIDIETSTLHINGTIYSLSSSSTSLDTYIQHNNTLVGIGEVGTILSMAPSASDRIKNASLEEENKRGERTVKMLDQGYRVEKKKSKPVVIRRVQRSASPVKSLAKKERDRTTEINNHSVDRTDGLNHSFGRNQIKNPVVLKDIQSKITRNAPSPVTLEHSKSIDPADEAFNDIFSNSSDRDETSLVLKDGLGTSPLDGLESDDGMDQEFDNVFDKDIADIIAEEIGDAALNNGGYASIINDENDNFLAQESISGHIALNDNDDSLIEKGATSYKPSIHEASGTEIHTSNHHANSTEKHSIKAHSNSSHLKSNHQEIQCTASHSRSNLHIPSEKYASVPTHSLYDLLAANDRTVVESFNTIATMKQTARKIQDEIKNNVFDPTAMDMTPEEFREDMERLIEAFKGGKVTCGEIQNEIRCRAGNKG